MAAAHRDVAGLLRKHGYTELKKIGEGSFGKAILVQAADGTKLISKMVDVSRASSKETQDALKEGKVLASLQHPYIVRYKESFTESGWFCILMDFCDGGDLTKQLEQAKRTRKSLDEVQIMKWFTQAILALKYIHDRHILHRDLKPQNFFLSKNGTLKMGDFGISKVLECTIAVARTQIGTPYYLSPELCKERPYTWPSDIWSMGCILYEMCALKVPFDASSIPQLVTAITSGRIPSVPSNYSGFVRGLVSDMLNRDPNKRPSCDDILQKPEIQAVVRQLMEEAQEKEAASNSGLGGYPSDAVSGLDAPKPAAPMAPKMSVDGPYKDRAGTYKQGDQVEYLSTAHQNWLPATVIDVDVDGRILIDLKPNTWLLPSQQATNIRPRQGVPSVPVRASASPKRQWSPSGRARPPSRDASPRSAMQRSPSAGGARPGSRGPGSARGAYFKGDLCEFWSNSHQEWLPAVVIDTDATGRLIIDLKPNTWIDKDEQSKKLRPRAKVGVDRPPSGFGGRPSIGGSPQLPRPPAGGMNRSPSWGGGPPGARAPSPAGGRAMTPLGGRAASPSGRAMTPMGGRGREMTPRRDCSPVGSRGASPSGGAGYRPPRVSQSPLRAGAAAIVGM